MSTRAHELQEATLEVFSLPQGLERVSYSQNTARRVIPVLSVSVVSTHARSVDRSRPLATICGRVFTTSRGRSLLAVPRIVGGVVGGRLVLQHELPHLNRGRRQEIDSVR
eukprot:1194599-Prorocentrum_minimum.AAC.1